ncbi:MAG: DUF1826 domain-containing protein [Planctomycetia bacterium]
MKALARLLRSASRVRTVEDLAQSILMFDESCNAVVIARRPSPELSESAARFAGRELSNYLFRHDLADVSSESVARELGVAINDALAVDLALWCEVVGDLTGCGAVGVRLACVTQAMCPRFHIDRVTLRAVCTYAGPGTEIVDGPGIPLSWSPGDDEGDIEPRHVIQPSPMQVVLLKGEAWPGNEGAGVVHRSPAMPAGQRRLVLTVDAL